jgi:hypothetical protein
LFNQFPVGQTDGRKHQLASRTGNKKKFVLKHQQTDFFGKTTIHKPQKKFNRLLLTVLYLMAVHLGKKTPRFKIFKIWIFFRKGLFIGL